MVPSQSKHFLFSTTSEKVQPSKFAVEPCLNNLCIQCDLDIIETKGARNPDLFFLRFEFLP